jgi:hypothetical protein
MVDTRSRLAEEPMNASTTPWTFTVDLQIDKLIPLFSDLSAQFYMRITNLFNMKNVINVYQATGSATDDGFISDEYKSSSVVSYYGQQYVDFYRKINLENGQAYWDLAGKQLYDHPRQILFGMRIVY